MDVRAEYSPSECPAKAESRCIRPLECMSLNAAFLVMTSVIWVN